MFRISFQVLQNISAKKWISMMENHAKTILTKAVARKCSTEKGLIKNSQYLQKNTCAGVSFLITLQAWHCFPVNFEKPLRIPIVFCKTSANGCFCLVKCGFRPDCWKTLISLGNSWLAARMTRQICRRVSRCVGTLRIKDIGNSCPRSVLQKMFFLKFFLNSQRTLPLPEPIFQKVPSLQKAFSKFQHLYALIILNLFHLWFSRCLF